MPGAEPADRRHADVGQSRCAEAEEQGSEPQAVGSTWRTFDGMGTPIHPGYFDTRLPDERFDVRGCRVGYPIRPGAPFPEHALRQIELRLQGPRWRSSTSGDQRTLTRDANGSGRTYQCTMADTASESAIHAAIDSTQLRLRPPLAESHSPSVSTLRPRNASLVNNRHSQTPTDMVDDVRAFDRRRLFERVGDEIPPRSERPELDPSC